MTKQLISLRIEPSLYIELKKKPNMTRYIEGLIKEDLHLKHKSSVVDGVKKELLQDETFFREMADRLSVAPPKLEVSEDVPPCCLDKTTKCKHWEYDEYNYTWVNRNTGEAIET